MVLEWGRRDGLREPKPWFSLVFSLFPWPGEPGRLGEPRGREKPGACLREPKPSFSFVFSLFSKPGGPWGIKKHCFFIAFSRFWRGRGAREKKKQKKINSFGDGLREPKPWFSLVFSMFPWPGEPGRLGEPRGREKSGARLGSLGLASLERGLCAYRHRYWYRY